ncbi:MAG: hypothetical protein RL145_1534, partial [Pseudomonadota bacterium]
MKLTKHLVARISASLFVFAIPFGAGAQEAQPNEQMVSVLIKFLKEPGQSADARVQFIEASCKACVRSSDPAYERFNERESVLYLKVPRSRYLDLSF